MSDGMFDVNNLSAGSVVRCTENGALGISDAQEGDLFVMQGFGTWINTRTGSGGWSIATSHTPKAPDGFEYVSIICGVPLTVAAGANQGYFSIPSLPLMHEIDKKQGQHGLKSGDIFIRKSRWSWENRNDGHVYMYLSGMYYKLDGDNLRPSAGPRWGRRWRPHVVGSLSNTGAAFMAAYKATLPETPA